jgi:hypothetical protein
MRRLKYLIPIFIIISLVFCSCKNTPEIKIEKKIDSSIRVYLKENLPETYSIDSLLIVNIDSLTESEFLFMYKEFLTNTMDVLNSEMNAAHKVGDEQTMYDKIDMIGSANGVYNSILNRLERLLKHEDTTFYMYFVHTKAYFTISNQQKQMQEIGFPIDTAFQVVELSLY